MTEVSLILPAYNEAERLKTKVDLKRDVIGMGTQIIRLWRELKNG